MTRRILLGLAVLLVLGAAAGAWLNHRALDGIDRRFTADTLSASERRVVAEARRLKAAYGGRVWPGLARADLPVVLYNDRWEFLVGWPASAPEGWERAGSGELLDAPVWRRRDRDPRPFVVEVEDRWAARYPVPRVLERRHVLRARRDMDPLSAALIPVSLSTVPTDLYLARLLDVTFHAFQATRSEERFSGAVRIRERAAGRYPVADAGVSALWTEEGAALGRILAAEDREEACRAVETFRSIRERRRDRALLDSTLIAYERAQEWLQGLSKYAGMTFHRRAAAGSGAPAWVEYRPPPAHWEEDLRTLRSSLGRQGAERRFALSGLGLALALDRLVPGWKPGVLPGDRHLDELVAAACRGGEGTPSGQDRGGGEGGETALNARREAASIGGAGTFDGIVLPAVLATLPA